MIPVIPFAVGPAVETAAAASSASTPLTTLSPGTMAVLHEVCDSRSCALLRSLGLTGGSRFRVCRMGDPCIIQVRSTRIGLSREVADSVLVMKADGAPV